jgi:hypothetical protein
MNGVPKMGHHVNLQQDRIGYAFVSTHVERPSIQHECAVMVSGDTELHIARMVRPSCLVQLLCKLCANQVHGEDNDRTKKKDRLSAIL